MRNPSELVWIDVVDEDFWWTNFITGIRINSMNESVAEEYYTEKAYAMTDTGMSCL
jgi:hypothetical protein